MNIVEKALSELKPYPNNPKIHTEHQIEQLAKSITQRRNKRDLSRTESIVFR